MEKLPFLQAIYLQCIAERVGSFVRVTDINVSSVVEF